MYTVQLPSPLIRLYIRVDAQTLLVESTDWIDRPARHTHWPHPNIDSHVEWYCSSYVALYYRGPSARHTWRAIYFPSHAERERMLCMSACIYGAQSTRHCTIVGWLASMLTWRHLFSLHDMHWVVSIPMATTEICAIFELPNKGIVFEHKLATLVDAVV